MAAKSPELREDCQRCGGKRSIVGGRYRPSEFIPAPGCTQTDICEAEMLRALTKKTEKR